MEHTGRLAREHGVALPLPLEVAADRLPGADDPAEPLERDQGGGAASRGRGAMSMAGPLTFALFLLTVISLMAGFSVAFTLAGVGFFMAGMGWYVGAFDLSLLGAIPSRIFGTAMWSETMVAVPLFVFMGLMLEKSRVAEELLNSMGRLFGGLRGGLGISVFVVGALLAASTGVVGASVVTMGLMALPVMLKTGYDARFATGAICASGTLGQIIPPSIALIILAEQISNAHVSAQSQLGNWS